MTLSKIEDLWRGEYCITHSKTPENKPKGLENKVKGYVQLNEEVILMKLNMKQRKLW